MSSITQGDTAKLEAYRDILKKTEEKGATLESVREYVRTEVGKIHGESYGRPISSEFTVESWLEELFYNPFAKKKR